MRIADFVVIGLLVAALAWCVRRTRFAAAIECALPAMLLAFAFIPEERLRLMTIGAIGAAAFALAVVAGCRLPVVVVCGVILLRWLPLADLELLRELIVLAAALALLAAFRERTPGVAVAVLAVAVVTPIHPGRAMLFPFLLAAIVLLLRDWRWRVPAPLRAAVFAVAFALFALWPWSGVVARALPLFKRFDPPAGTTRGIGAALANGDVTAFDLPPHVRRVVVTASGENIPRMRGGKLLGTIDVVTRDGHTCTRELNVGDVSDFGFLRREQFIKARNSLPKSTPFDVYGYGATAFVKGNGRVAVSCEGRDLASLRIMGAGLPAAGRLQIESIELPAR